mmetsp:Transcript_46583/g.117275  ORF Transcript_46583/g.117275 Transcript_46583/m.117275 type:complete len:190 (-) Transcript_46583:161-730(-)|eukprot:CAMPEP_0177659632 /NCGR_PEP_ID=MMETSP0447-20121125/17555_1 /TAXON_ID=0 /ORGANISM="Stygamoeba regulata, Strain BSH-02190019" /LENGTH=189 /DNA_ID=CAMNT_0019164533 /DNA_START=86 /DNA_END=655 /DNA_ORIENTATION=-
MARTRWIPVALLAAVLLAVAGMGEGVCMFNCAPAPVLFDPYNAAFVFWDARSGKAQSALPPTWWSTSGSSPTFHVLGYYDDIAPPANHTALWLPWQKSNCTDPPFQEGIQCITPDYPAALPAIPFGSDDLAVLYADASGGLTFRTFTSNSSDTLNIGVCRNLVASCGAQLEGRGAAAPRAPVIAATQTA